MSEFKLPVLGLPSPTAQSTTSSTEVGRWGILGGGILYSLKPHRLEAYYRKDLKSEKVFNKYLNDRRVHCIDPYLHFEAIH